jgi:hypothetical protein
MLGDAMKRKIEIIDQIEGQPVIGKMYLVMCVKVSVESGKYECGVRGWVPIMGPLHDDREYIGVKIRHYHIDWRFARFDDDGAGPVEQARKFGRFVSDKQVMSLPELRRRRCVREMGAFPTHLPDYSGDGTPIDFIRKLETAYRDVKLKPDCMICPHRGISLAGVTEKDGVRVCPGHGLAWRMDTGELSPRLTAPLKRN